MPATYILLGSDGRHVLLGRHAAPDTAEIGQIGASLRRSGLGGWIARMEGDYYARTGELTLTAVAVAAPTIVPFTDAAAAFRARRREALGLTPACAATGA